jgi:hypothetical protein
MMRLGRANAVADTFFVVQYTLFERDLIFRKQ